MIGWNSELGQNQDKNNMSRLACNTETKIYNGMILSINSNIIELRL